MNANSPTVKKGGNVSIKTKERVGKRGVVVGGGVGGVGGFGLPINR